MGHQQGDRKEEFNTITSTFNWRLKNIEFMREKEFSHELKTQEIKFENSDFKWFAKITNGLEDTENAAKKQLQVKIFRDKDETGNYEKRTFDVKICVKKRNYERTFEKQGILLHNQFIFKYNGLTLDYTLMDINFEVKIHEYDITGYAVKSINDISYKLKILKDMGKLLETGKNADMVLVLKDGSTVLVHKDIIARSPFFRNIINMKLTEKIPIDKALMMKYLKFIYTGELANDTIEHDLAKLSEIADKHQFVSFKNICSEMLKMKIAENKMNEGCDVS